MVRNNPALHTAAPAAHNGDMPREWRYHIANNMARMRSVRNTNSKRV